MTMKKLLVTDIDRTLSTGESVSPEVSNACGRLRENGWEIMVATGRILTTAMPHIRAVGAAKTAIVYDGARVMDVASGEALFQVLMEPDTVFKVLSMLWDATVELQVMGNERGVCRPQDVTTRAFFSSALVPIADSLNAPVPLEEVFRIILFGQPEIIRDLDREVRSVLGAQAEVVRSGDHFLDILPPGVSKGAAFLRFLDEFCPEPPEIIVAAGDHENDRTLLESAHVAVVPEDAVPSLLSMADVIMPSVQRHGFVALAEYLIRNEFPADTVHSVVL